MRDHVQIQEGEQIMSYTTEYQTKFSIGYKCCGSLLLSWFSIFSTASILGQWDEQAFFLFYIFYFYLYLKGQSHFLTSWEILTIAYWLYEHETTWSIRPVFVLIKRISMLYGEMNNLVPTHRVLEGYTKLMTGILHWSALYLNSVMFHWQTLFDWRRLWWLWTVFLCCRIIV